MDGRIASMRRLLALTCTIVLVDTIFYGTLTPLVPYFSEEFGLSKSAVSTRVGLSTLPVQMLYHHSPSYT